MKNGARLLLALVVAAAFFWLLYLLAPVITPFAIAAALAYLGDPLVDRLEKIKFFRWTIGRSPAVTMVFLLLSFVILGLFLIVIPEATEQVRQLVEKTPVIMAWVAGTAIPWIESNLGITLPGLDPASLTETVKTYWKELAGASMNLLGSVSAGGQMLVHVLMNLVLVPVVTFYLLRDWDHLIAGIRNLVPTRQVLIVGRLAGEIDEVLGAFIRGQLMVMLILAAFYTIGLALFGLDLALPIGVFTGLAVFVPYLGFGLGLEPREHGAIR